MNSENENSENENSDSQANHAVLCLSGGMDSTALLYHLLAAGNSISAISFDYGQKHRYELECVKRQLDYLADHQIQIDHQLIDISSFGSKLNSALTDPTAEMPLGHYEEPTMKQTVVPNRNSIFFSIAASLALSLSNQNDHQVRLSLAVHSGDHAIYPDCRPEFYDAIWKSFEIGNWDADKVALYLPYLKLDKAAILKDASAAISQLGLDFDQVFRNTCTSYMPDSAGRAHGLTGSDVERILAFHEIGRQDPIEYQQSWQTVLEEAQRTGQS